MTGLELKDSFSKMTRTELLRWFTAVETGWHQIFPAVSELIKLTEERETCKKNKDEKPGGLIGIIIGVGLAVFGLLMVISSGKTDWFSGFFRKVFGFGGLIAAVIAFAATISERKSAVKRAKEAAARLVELETLVPEAQRKAQGTVNEHSFVPTIMQMILPKECSNFRYLRIFVSYFEDGRAENLKEAYALFEEMLHRERMEENAQTQVQAARSAEAAAYAAMNAANNAAITASQAKSSADWAAYMTRFKD